ncbi:hypothetical protein [Agrobacterium tumefaciens]|uniref:HNH endonuclease n=1 Tax=Agrobacterium tumefaciens TaxID=358 RepID=A0A2L2LMT0_AGRTU|nr:hypothetical protein [Agrobacterium tumefaciens]AVH45650.1 hypothetical protein At1D1609_56170 [Agrobacterium tumefaciens]NSY99311.1 hypothetical protein [Agrobacterium tumefaciens]
MPGICALCRRLGELCESHAIPKAFIRPILRANGGSVILVPTGPGKIHRGGDVLKGKLLCATCEEKTNKDIDAPAIRFLSDLKRQVDAGGARKGSFPSKDLAIFAISVLWRAVLIKGYTSVRLDKAMRETFRVNILDRGQSPLQHCSIRIGRLIDRTPVGGFDTKSLANFIFPPSGHVSATGQQVVTMAMHGLIFELGFPRQRAASFRIPGYLKDASATIMLPDFDIFASPPIVDAMVTGYGKDMSGHSTLGRAERTQRQNVVGKFPSEVSDGNDI